MLHKSPSWRALSSCCFLEEKEEISFALELMLALNLVSTSCFLLIVLNMLEPQQHIKKDVAASIIDSKTKYSSRIIFQRDFD